MNQNRQVFQNPSPGARMIRFCGDRLTLRLELSQSGPGTAWVRTNIGRAELIRDEIIREVENKETPLGRAWFDIPMTRVDEKSFEATLPLTEVGHFEAKCFFLKEGGDQPIWPPGTNTTVNVEQADACCANMIYNAFVRQFGPNKAAKQILEPTNESAIRTLDESGYTIIPPSGTFRDLIGELDFIIGELGCRLLLLLPIHPTPTTYGRMGRFGSPYASLSFTAVDPALAEFDSHATPLEQFIELVDAVHLRNAKILIDIAINHTGWAARLHETHPHWLIRSDEGQIEIPGAWGVAWEDLTKLDYSQPSLWQYMADVFIKWCHRDVDGFRCDAGYMIPLSAWRYIVAKVRSQFPEVLFLLEGLGGKISVTRELLNSANLNWAYSELFQNYDRGQIERYLPEANDISSTDGITVHFAETHDNPRLAGQSKTYARMRTALGAFSAHNGAFGFANGVEWFAWENIDVHDVPSLNWGAEPNQVAEIRRINRLLKVHPVFHAGTSISMHQREEGNFIVLLRQHHESKKRLLIIVNLDAENRTIASWDIATVGLQGSVYYDLMTGEKIPITQSNGLNRLLLEPGQVLCLSDSAEDLNRIENFPDDPFLLPERIKRQRLCAKALQVISHTRGIQHLENISLEQAARQLMENPLEFCDRFSSNGSEPRFITWKWPRDLKREVMIPPHHFLLIRADCGFRARIMDRERTIASEVSLPVTEGSHVALFMPQGIPGNLKTLRLALSVYEGAEGQGCRHEDSRLLVLPRGEDVRIKRIFRHSDLLDEDFTFLATNGRGGMLRSSVSWGKLASRYDGLLAANISPHFPEDRWMMFSRCRAWVVFQDYSQPVNSDCISVFCPEVGSAAIWQYQIPTGQGEHILISVRAEMIADENTAILNFFRHPARHQPGRLEDAKPVKLILRPDIENRNFHEFTKAYAGPEDQWPRMVTVFPNGFDFTPDNDHHFQIRISDGNFVWEPDWQYMVNRPIDVQRGYEADSDLFSPGYLAASIEGNQTVVLRAQISLEKERLQHRTVSASIDLNALEENGREIAIPQLLQSSLDHYVVKRGHLKTVIAGYPWFLDWGRDALIFVRGLIAAGKLDDARDVLFQFARFEERGTLPNMIQAENTANRDTSDAPFWLIKACADFVHTEDDTHIIESDCGGRLMREILLSIGRSVKAGTCNGVSLDPESGLIFSLAHFSWMDTNHPAGTPRQGYPIEIQALWYAALRFLSEIDAAQAGKAWHRLAQKVQRSILKYFWQTDLGFLADCLHAVPGQTARGAAPDDALRPNQLIAITLGAVTAPRKCESILAACQKLLVPGAIRSLADQPVRRGIPIYHRGELINNPHRPYQGRYAGDEDTQRKPAYHNGTAWTWLLPSFCEAWAMTYGEAGRETALAVLSSSARLLESGCLGHMPEILDGDYPHTPRGCDAQAWGASELLRVWLKLS